MNTILQINDPQRSSPTFLQLGFRPFFLFAGCYAIASMMLWFGFYHFPTAVPDQLLLAPITWHAHEMIYGYTFAVVAGFLLTAVKNWTNIQTLHGKALLGLLTLWCLARLAPLLPPSLASYLLPTMDLAFDAWLCVAVLLPIIKTRQWIQLGVLSKLLLMLLSNVLFYLGIYGFLPHGAQWGIYAGLYLLLSLILLMARRVMPFFIKQGLANGFTPLNRHWLDIASLVTMLIFIVVEVFLPYPQLAALLASILCVLHLLRLTDWHHRGIWKKPLLWSLFLAYGWLVLGFGFTAVSKMNWLAPMLAVHAFTVGGIGLMTLGMMARVTLGHTGRNILQPPAAVDNIFILILIAAVLRVIFPVLLPQHYQLWIAVSQFFWMGAFGLFLWIYAPMLVKVRIDGRAG